MTMLESHSAPILVVTGSLTALAIVVTIAPAAALRVLFGSATPDRTPRPLDRHWGLLVAPFGGLLIYAGYAPALREPVMAAAAVEKLGVAAIFGIALPRRPVLLAVIAADATMAILYLLILASRHSTV